MTIKTDIIPFEQIRTGIHDSLDLEAICAFVTLGFFVSDTTYFKGLKSLPPASLVKLDSEGCIKSSERYFEWHHSPRDISLKKVVNEFADLFEGILSENKDPVWTIPISGGLDSRTLVAAAQQLNRRYKGYSYCFRNGHDETAYGRKMSDSFGFDFHAFTVEAGTLWTGIEKLARINGCYSEFTHPRQFALYNELKSINGTLLLGHWGDVLFDSMHVSEEISAQLAFDTHMNRIVKAGGLELGSRLWKYWGLGGSLMEYIRDSLLPIYNGIDITQNNPRLRAFKSWTHAVRWTNNNLSIFRDFGPNVYPYMDNRMVNFICNVPEKWLSGRKIQIEYIKMRYPELARIPWQSHLPFNLYNHHLNRVPFNLPLRLYNKAKHMLSEKALTTRNWEIQFLGSENEIRLKEMLTDDHNFAEWVPSNISRHFLEDFLRRRNPDTYHPVSMLLTLSAFHRYILSQFRFKT